ncbi:hypothetical protein Dda_6036 [Drechslerella dactyloides]|uniref:DUF7603 domain-containing protein n=1 Tax=Drechslerella dactyloides TaxID=74499 RepID=A0AAD6IV04_DREDA|nr:hypothetical protein Dda_6036 [Drechslerella dactyloides]
MESPLRRSMLIDTSLFPQPPSRNRAVAPANASSAATRTPTQSFFRQSVSSTSSSIPYSPPPPHHSKDRSFSSTTGHSKSSSSDFYSHLTAASTRSSVYSEDNDLDNTFDLRIQSPITATTSPGIDSTGESPVDPFFKQYHSAPPKSPVLELFRSQLSDRSPVASPIRWSLDLFSGSLHSQTHASAAAHVPHSPLRHPLHQNLSSSDIGSVDQTPRKPETSQASASTPDVISAPQATSPQQSHNYPSISSRIIDQFPISTERISKIFTMPHVVTQPTVSNTNMLNRSNSASSDSSFVPRTPVRTKTAGGKFGSFFGWGSSTAQDISPTDDSRISLAEQRMSKIPSNIDVSLANSQPSHPKRTDSGISLPPRTPMTVEETLEEELRIISADLAASIRRELELEDLVESLQTTADSQGKLGTNAGKRTSDYFSDAGTGTSSYDLDLPPKEQLDYDRVVRKSEQAQAQIRLELTQKIQDERQRRKGVELQVRELEELVSQVDAPSGLRPASPGRIRDLEIALDDARRKLSEERNLKANFEDLVKAIRDELQGYRNERDNLRDEVVPQLRARVEGLEAELAESQKTPYEATKMQQEIDDLRQKYAQLMESNRQMIESHRQSEHMLHSAPASASTPTTPGSAMFKDRESLLERLRDIEAQRDALQLGLRNLRMRTEVDNKKASERIRTLEWEKARALRPSYRKMRKDKENAAFKNQLERLRHRSDNAVDSKYVCERNLASLRLDLDRSEQELEDLRALLREQDDLARQMEELQESCKQLVAQSEGGEDMEQLASELRSRAVVNAMLRKRLVDAIEKGDQERLMANSKINAFCELLKSLEEKIGDAQHDLDEAAHERDQEAKDIKDTKSISLRRIDENAALTTQSRSPVITGKKPKIAREGSQSKDTRVYVLQHRVEQLEKAITNTDIEMEDLESRLNVTLLEASELRSETQQSSQHIGALRSKLATLQS